MLRPEHPERRNLRHIIKDLFPGKKFNYVRMKLNKQVDECLLNPRRYNPDYWVGYLIAEVNTDTQYIIASRVKYLLENGYE